MNLDIAVRLASIGLINLALSGDNAIVIGMAAASLPHRQRRAAIIGGGLLAIALRVVLTGLATRLMVIPLLSAAGGLLLFVVTWGLLKVDVGPEAHAAATGHGLRNAVELIVVADLTMSLDNIIAVGGTAHGDDGLVLAGLVLSMPILMAAGGVLSGLIDRFRWIVYLGAGAICFTAARMIFEDGVVEARLPWGSATSIAISLTIAIGVPLLFRWVHARRAAARLAEQPTGPMESADDR